MTLLEALGKYLEASGIGIYGEDIFLNMQPSDPADCITIIDTGGYSADDTGVIRTPTFQIIVRNENYIDAKNRSEVIYALNLKDNFQIGEYYIYLAEFEDEPTFMGEDNNNRSEITMNLKLERRN